MCRRKRTARANSKATIQTDQIKTTTKIIIKIVTTTIGILITTNVLPVTTGNNFKRYHDIKLDGSGQ